MEIENINENNASQIKQFIQRIPGFEIEEKILSKVTILKENDIIKGMISYENYVSNGLIRYFIFQKDVAFEDLELLFKEMVKRIKTEGISKIITIIQQDELKSFFEKLKFNEIAIDKIYIGEKELRSFLKEPAMAMIYNV